MSRRAATKPQAGQSFGRGDLGGRIDAALDRRRVLHADPDTDAYRLIHADADGMPGVTLDRFADVGVLSLYRSFTDAEEAALSTALEHVLGPKAPSDAPVYLRSLYLKRRPRTARDSQRNLEHLAPSQPVWGESRETVIARENGLRYLIRPGEGLAVGLYLDMRDIRAWVHQRAAGATVLNCFAYTCGFAVAARAGGAKRAANVDLSKRVLSWGEENAALNGQAVDRQDSLAGDVFEWLGRLARRAERFDQVILDPPAFATSKHGRFSVAKDYASLAEAAARLSMPGGLVLACCNRASLPKGHLRRQVSAGVERAGRRIRKIEPLLPSAVDFPTPAGERPAIEVLAIRLD